MSAFISTMLTPIGQTRPNYVTNFTATDNSWTAKFVFIAANAWDATQSSWLDATLAQPSTYTFVLRHEPAAANTAPGVTPSEAIMRKYPYTLAIVGHTHTYAHSSATPTQITIGNGGAPLMGGVIYGFGLVSQRRWHLADRRHRLHVRRVRSELSIRHSRRRLVCTSLNESDIERYTTIADSPANLTGRRDDDRRAGRDARTRERGGRQGAEEARAAIRIVNGHDVAQMRKAVDLVFVSGDPVHRLEAEADGGRRSRRRSGAAGSLEHLPAHAVQGACRTGRDLRHINLNQRIGIT